MKKKIENINQKWMKRAVLLSKKAKNTDEIPVGAVLVLNNKIIGEGWNSSIQSYDPTAHAEIIAIRNGGKLIKNYRLLNTILYVTLEPCIMCIGAILHARIYKIIYGCISNNNKNLISSISKKVFKILKIRNKMPIIKNNPTEKCKKNIKNFFKFKRKY